MKHTLHSRPVRGRVRIALLLMTAALAVILLAGPTGTPASGDGPLVMAEPDGRYPVHHSELRLRTPGGETLPATLFRPVTSAGRMPGMVLVHGSGAGARRDYAALGRTFAAAGIATLTYDKRTVGYSLTRRDYSQLADDAVAAAALLRRQHGVDPGQVGLWGISEGGWVAPLAATRAPETAFLIVVGANGHTPLRQQVWSEAVKVEAAGIRGSLVGAVSRRTYQLLESAGMFPEARYQPVPVLRRLTLPVLGVWGALDRSSPPQESVRSFRRALDAAGNRHYRLRTFPDAGHTLRSTADGFRESPKPAPGYVDLVASWVPRAVRGEAGGQVVDGTARQPRQTQAVPTLDWFESAPAQFSALGVMAAGFGGFGLAALARRTARRVRPGTVVEHAPLVAGVAAATGALTVIGTLVTVGGLTVAGGGSPIRPGPLLLGRPLTWLLLQAMALVVLLAGAALVAHLVRHQSSRALGVRPADARPPASRPSGGERVRLSLLLVGIAVFVPWAAFWGLLSP